MVTYGLCILGVLTGSQNFCHTFFQWYFISRHGAYLWSSFLGKCPCYFGHFVLMCSSSTFLSHIDNTSSLFLPIFFGKFQQEIYASMWGHYESKIVGEFSRPFSEALGLTIDILWWYTPYFYGRVCPIYSIGSWALVASYLCFRFRIFDRLVLEEYVFHVEGVCTCFNHVYVQREIAFLL